MQSRCAKLLILSSPDNKRRNVSAGHIMGKLISKISHRKSVSLMQGMSIFFISENNFGDINLTVKSAAKYGPYCAMM